MLSYACRLSRCTIRTMVANNYTSVTLCSPMAIFVVKSKDNSSLQRISTNIGRSFPLLRTHSDSLLHTVLWHSKNSEFRTQ